jgi:hypothetical protein
MSDTNSVEFATDEDEFGAASAVPKNDKDKHAKSYTHADPTFHVIMAKLASFDKKSLSIAREAIAQYVDYGVVTKALADRPTWIPKLLEMYEVKKALVKLGLDPAKLDYQEIDKALDVIVTIRRLA